MRIQFLFIILLLPVCSFSGQQLDVAGLMTHKEYKEAGLDKLSPDEVRALNLWLSGFAGSGSFSGKENDSKKEGLSEPSNDSAPKTYKIQRVSRDTSFEINNRNFEASKKCPGFKRGDKVVFLEGSAYGLCTTALFVKSGSSETCKVWCEEE